MPSRRSKGRQRDVFADLLHESRGLHPERAAARDEWFEALTADRKEETLFELEMLLKGLGCFGNPRNVPGSGGRDSASVAREYRDELLIVRETLQHCIHLARHLLGHQDHLRSPNRYLEAALPEDPDRSGHLRDQLSQETPEDSLFLLCHSFEDLVAVADAMLQLPSATHAQYQGLLGTITREIGRNLHFNPLVALEFRPEHDRIRDVQVLEALRNVRNEAAHRVTALSLLTLFRCLRYLALIDHYAGSATTVRCTYILLAVYRNDMRTLVRFLTKRAPDLIAEGLERELLEVDADSLRGHYDELARYLRSVGALRGTLETLAARLQMDVRRTFERELPAPDAQVSDEELGPRIVVLTASLRASIHNAIRLLCMEIQPEAAPPQLASDEQARQTASERLRRDVWMFGQILRGFLAKAKTTSETPDRWSSHTSFRFVREFLEHFHNIGYQLVRSSDYERLDGFMAALDSLREADVLDPGRMQVAIDECARFQDYLEELFSKISQRAELRDVPFDRRDAAQTLRVYLGAA